MADILLLVVAEKAACHAYECPCPLLGLLGSVDWPSGQGPSWPLAKFSQ